MKILLILVLLFSCVNLGKPFRCFDCGYGDKLDCFISLDKRYSCETTKACVQINAKTKTMQMCDTEALGFNTCKKARNGEPILGEKYEIVQCLLCLTPYCNSAILKKISVLALVIVFVRFFLWVGLSMNKLV